MENFIFDINNKNVPTVSLVTSGLSFNEASIKLLGSPDYIAIGIDKLNKKVAIVAVDGEDGQIKSFVFTRGKIKKKRIIVTASWSL